MGHGRTAAARRQDRRRHRRNAGSGRGDCPPSRQTRCNGHRLLRPQRGARRQGRGGAYRARCQGGLRPGGPGRHRSGAKRHGGLRSSVRPRRLSGQRRRAHRPRDDPQHDARALRAHVQDQHRGALLPDAGGHPHHEARAHRGRHRQHPLRLGAWRAVVPRGLRGLEDGAGHAHQEHRLRRPARPHPGQRPQHRLDGHAGRARDPEEGPTMRLPTGSPAQRPHARSVACSSRTRWRVPWLSCARRRAG